MFNSIIVIYDYTIRSLVSCQRYPNLLARFASYFWAYYTTLHNTTRHYTTLRDVPDKRDARDEITSRHFTTIEL